MSKPNSFEYCQTCQKPIDLKNDLYLAAFPVENGDVRFSCPHCVIRHPIKTADNGDACDEIIAILEKICDLMNVYYGGCTNDTAGDGKND